MGCTCLFISCYFTAICPQVEVEGVQPWYKVIDTNVFLLCRHVKCMSSTSAIIWIPKYSLVYMLPRPSITGSVTDPGPQLLSSEISTCLLWGKHASCFPAAAPSQTERSGDTEACPLWLWGFTWWSCWNFIRPHWRSRMCSLNFPSFSSYMGSAFPGHLPPFPYKHFC